MKARGYCFDPHIIMFDKILCGEAMWHARAGHVFCKAMFYMAMFRS